MRYSPWSGTWVITLSADDDDDDGGAYDDDGGGEYDDGDGGEYDDGGDGKGDDNSFWPMKSKSLARAMDRKAALFTSSVWVIWELYKGDMGEWRGMRSMLNPIRVLLASTNNTLQNEKISINVIAKGCMFVNLKEEKDW